MIVNGVGVNEPQSPRAVAQYISTLTSELAEIARHHRMDGLAFILDMAHTEAQQIGNASSDSEQLSQ